jgi:glycosyltransferase involved in cell wall biosynthesis
VLAQSFKDFHLYILDDASTDGTSAYGKKIKDKRVTYIRQPKNLGVSANWLSGLGRVNSEFYCLLMDDDFYTADFLKSRILALRKNPQSAVAFGSFQLVDAKGKLMGKPRELPFQNGQAIGPVEMIETLGAGGIHIGGMVFRKEFTQSIWRRAANYGIVIDSALVSLLVFQQERGGVFVQKSNFRMTHQPNQIYHTHRRQVYEEALRLTADMGRKKSLSAESRRFLKVSASLMLQDWALYEASGEPILALKKLALAWIKAPFARAQWRRRMYILACILGFRYEGLVTNQRFIENR